MKTQSTSSKETPQRQLDRQFFFARLVNVLTWGLSASVSIYYTIREPRDASMIIGARIWDQNFKYETGLSMDPNMVITYWALIYAAQFVDMLIHIFQRSQHPNRTAISHHFSTNNLLHSLFLVLFVRSAFGWAEGILILNFANLSVLYFQHNRIRHFTHISVICGPLAWNFVAIFWNWAIAVTAGLGYNSTIEGFGLFFIWGILGYGVFCLIIFQDLAMAFLLAYLCVSIAVAQHFLQHSSRLGVPPIVIASLLAILMFVVVVRYAWGFWVEYRKRGENTVDACSDGHKEPC